MGGGGREWEERREGKLKLICKIKKQNNGTLINPPQQREKEREHRSLRNLNIAKSQKECGVFC